MVLEWTLSKRLKIDLSLLQPQSTSQEKHGSMGDHILQHQSTGYLRTRFI